MKRRALCIGINNYPGTQMDLRGCVNDARDWSALLEGRGFAVTSLLDAQATRAQLTAGLAAVIGAAKEGDVVVITYSGHGTYAPDESGDERDGFDEALCPHDVKAAGPLIDDEIHRLFLSRAAGVHLVLISDSCHSGTLTRSGGQGQADPSRPLPRFMPIGNWMDGDAAAARAVDAGRVKGGSAFGLAARAREGDLLLAGCEEGPKHFSYDAHFDGRPVGAFSFFAKQKLARLPEDASYDDWIAAITPNGLPTAECPQTPQIVGSAAARRRRVFG